MKRSYLMTRLYRELLSVDSFRMFSVSSQSNGDHLSRTQSSSRNEVMSPATVVKLEDLSSTVKLLCLKVNNTDFTFKAGQWVDTHIPGLETVGGFSMCSAPGLLHRQGLLHLAVKYSKHPPAHWVHTKCQPGDVLLLRVGGDFHLDPPKGASLQGDVLLVAGGVGINPLFSMVAHVADVQDAIGEPASKARLLLLYSARTHAELIFKNQLEDICQAHSNITTWFYVSRETPAPSSVQAGRISEEDLRAALSRLKLDKLQVYLCGPLPMIKDMEEFCLKNYISPQQIFYEKWW